MPNTPSVLGIRFCRCLLAFRCRVLTHTLRLESGDVDFDRHSPTTGVVHECRGVDELLNNTRMKFRHVKKIVLAVLNSAQLKLESVNLSGGSHQVFHFGDSNAPLTLVEKHTGAGRDSLVPRRQKTMIYNQLVQIAIDAIPKEM